MDYSDACVALTKEAEGYVQFPRPDPVGLPTVGYGHKLRAGEDFHAGLTQAQAEVLLRTDLDEACAAVNRLAHPPTGFWQGAVDALTDFTFNLGEGKLASSTLLRELNAGNVHGAAQEFPRWVFASHVALPGLIRRRGLEQALFLSGAPTMPSSGGPTPPS